MEDYKVEIKRLVARIGEIELVKIADDTHLAKELGLDSLQALELMTALESRFNVSIPQEQLSRFTSVHSLAELVTELQVGVVSSAD